MIDWLAGLNQRHNAGFFQATPLTGNRGTGELLKRTREDFQVHGLDLISQNRSAATLRGKYTDSSFTQFELRSDASTDRR